MPLSWLLVLVSNPWHCLVYRCIAPASAPPSRGLLFCVSQIPLSFLRTPAIGFRATLIQDDLILRSLTRLHLQRPHFQISSNSQVSGVRTWTCFSGRHSLTHFSPLLVTPSPRATLSTVSWFLIALPFFVCFLLYIKGIIEFVLFVLGFFFSKLYL